MDRQFKSFTQASNLSDHDLRMNKNSSNFIEKFSTADLEILKTSRKRRINQISTFGMERQFKFFTQVSNLSDHDLRMNKNSSNFMEKFVKADLESWKIHVSVESIRSRPSEWKRLIKSNTQASNLSDHDLRLNTKSSNFMEKFAKADLDSFKPHASVESIRSRPSEWK